MSTTLTITSKGQVTLRKEVLHHLGVAPGEKVQVDLLPDGRAEIRAKRLGGSITQMRGFLRDKTDGTRLTLEELDRAIALAGAKAGRSEE